MRPFGPAATSVASYTTPPPQKDAERQHRVRKANRKIDGGADGPTPDTKRGGGDAKKTHNIFYSTRIGGGRDNPVLRWSTHANPNPIMHEPRTRRATTRPHHLALREGERQPRRLFGEQEQAPPARGAAAGQGVFPLPAGHGDRRGRRGDRSRRRRRSQCRCRCRCRAPSAGRRSRCIRAFELLRARRREKGGGGGGAWGAKKREKAGGRRG